jgi:urea transporter/murein DD-endopeptidase MepM/ murein hydrolase activator NlpD
MWTVMITRYVRAVLCGYAALLFSASPWLGALLLLATLLAPSYGLPGLAGLLIALATAEALGFERAETRSGAYLYNPLLVSLGVTHVTQALHLSPGLQFLLLAVSAVLALLVTVILSAALARQGNLPAMSLPFVLVTLMVYLVAYGMVGMPVAGAAPAYLLPEPAGLPAPVLAFFQGMGAIFFLPHAAVGGLAALGLLATSRLAVLYALAGFAAGVGTLQGMGMDSSPAGLAPVAFNFIFGAIAVGGIFLIPSPASLLLVVLASCISALLAVAGATLGSLFAIPPLALPMNLAVLAVLAALRLRSAPTGAILTPFLPETPEANFHRYHTGRLRFPHLLLPHLQLPVCGEWTVTQGMHGAFTHRGAWAHALDFEILDAQGRRAQGDEAQLANYYSYLAPVTAPCAGTVMKVVARVADNAIGANNLDANWGNLVLLMHDSGVYVLLCHLAKDSIVVKEGDRVLPGTLLARCGSSGRSPVPHLHLQVQYSPVLGAPTSPFVLSHLAVRDGEEAHYLTDGVPAEGSHVRAVNSRESLAACFDKLPSPPCRYRVVSPDRQHDEVIACILDDAGAFVWHSTTTDAVLTARLTDHVWYALDFRGDPHSLLRDLWLGLARLPLTTEHGLYWDDRMDARPVLHPLARCLYDLAGPFLPYPTLTLRQRIRSLDQEGGDGRVTVQTDLTPHGLPALALHRVPRTLTVTLAPHQGVVGLTITYAQGQVEIQRIDQDTTCPAAGAWSLS